MPLPALALPAAAMGVGMLADALSGSGKREDKALNVNTQIASESLKGQQRRGEQETQYLPSFMDTVMRFAQGQLGRGRPQVFGRGIFEPQLAGGQGMGPSMAGRYTGEGLKPYAGPPGPDDFIDNTTKSRAGQQADQDRAWQKYLDQEEWVKSQGKTGKMADVGDDPEETGDPGKGMTWEEYLLLTAPRKGQPDFDDVDMDNYDANWRQNKGGVDDYASLSEIDKWKMRDALKEEAADASIHGLDTSIYGYTNPWEHAMNPEPEQPPIGRQDFDYASLYGISPSGNVPANYNPVTFNNGNFGSTLSNAVGGYDPYASGPQNMGPVTFNAPVTPESMGVDRSLVDPTTGQNPWGGYDPWANGGSQTVYEGGITPAVVEQVIASGDPAQIQALVETGAVDPTALLEFLSTSSSEQMYG